MAYLRLGRIFAYIPEFDPAKAAGYVKKNKAGSIRPSRSRLRSMINRVRLLCAKKCQSYIKVTIFDRNSACGKQSGLVQKPVEVKDYADYETDYHGLLLTAGIKYLL
jgi:hypothetical protein